MPAPYRPKRDAVVAYKLGKRLEQEGTTAEALAAYSRAVAADPEFIKAYLARGALYLKQGDKHRSRIDTGRAHWLKHRRILEPYKVKAGDRRTTPRLAVEIAKAFPELASRSKTAVRLHPRYGDEPAVDQSKLGGVLLWPRDEPWPVCNIHAIPYVGVLQLRAGDFPEMAFRLGTDLFQLLWCPREHFENLETGNGLAEPAFFWRRRADVKDVGVNPTPIEPYYDYMPFPCRVMQERVTEYPDESELDQDLADRIHAWENANLTEDGFRRHEYASELSVCEATKIGGHPRWLQWPRLPVCSCGQPMELLLTLSSVEWNGLFDPCWTPIEDQRLLQDLLGPWEDWGHKDSDVQRAFWMPTGLCLGDAGLMQFFICRHCPEWPIWTSAESQ
jgi:tetratricopeptide (TPR) repeat protein